MRPLVRPVPWLASGRSMTWEQGLTPPINHAGACPTRSSCKLHDAVDIEDIWAAAAAEAGSERPGPGNTITSR